MKYVYASRTGNVEKLIKTLGFNAEKIETGDEKVNEDFILFTYTDGHGIVPEVVEHFLKTNGEHLKNVVAAGNSTRHPETFAFAGDVLAKEYDVKCLYKLDGEATDEDVAAIKALLD